MFKRSTTFQVNKRYDQLASEMQHAQQNNKFPQPSVNLEEVDNTATFSVFQGLINADTFIMKSKGSLRPISDDTTQVDLSIDYIVTSTLFTIISMLLGFIILTMLLRSVLSPPLLLVVMIVSMGIFVFSGGYSVTNFRSQMNAFFGDQWRS